MRQILLEKTRNNLIAKSRKARGYSDGSGNRWDAKTKCRVANTVQDYNKIDMDTFWKTDVLKFAIKVQGQTDTYFVTVEFNRILDKLQREVQRNNNKLDIKFIYRALVDALNSSDIKVDCTCPDFKYRFSYAATQQNYKSGQAENRAAVQTNPHDDLGASCKHVLCVLNNADWVRKISSVINNYIWYARDNFENLYAKYIFPKIYGMPYNRAVQMAIQYYDNNGNEIDTMKSDESIVNLSNALGKVRGRFQKGSNKNPVTQKE